MKLRDKSLRIWRAIVAAGVDGIGSKPLYDQFRGEFTEVEISTGLQCLTSGNYAERTGANRYGTWKITQDCKLPKGEPAPAWIVEQVADDSDAADRLAEARELAEKRKALKVVMPKRPASVFNLGGQPDLDALVEPVETPETPTLPISRDFLCSLDNEGELYLFSNGSELVLDVKHTRKLLHYLDHLRADELLASLAEVPA